MTVEQVFALLEKGFSRDDIMKFTEAGASSPAPEAAGADPGPISPSLTDQDAKPAEKIINAGPAANAADDPEPGKDPEPSATEKRLDSIEASITKLIKSVQANNLKSDSFGGGADSLEEQTDKIMASIIRPERSKEDHA